MPRGPNYVHLLIVLLFVSATVIQWVFRKVQEQAALKRAKTARERRVTEGLRTGRPPAFEPLVTATTAPPPTAPLSHADARRRLQELAERRQRQLEELRRRGQSGGAAPAPGAPVEREVGPPRPPPMVLIGPSGPVVQRPPVPGQARQASGPSARPPGAPPAARPRGTPARAPAPAMRRAPGAAPAGQAGTARAAEQRKKSKDRPGARPTATAARREPEAPAVTAAPSAGAAMTAGIHPGTGFALPGTAMLGGRAATIQDWRRAIVMQEILAPPLAIREQHGNDYPI